MPFMIFVPILSITAFVVILYYDKWKWVETDNKLSLAQSIFGIVTIGLSIIQVQQRQLFENSKKFKIHLEKLKKKGVYCLFQTTSRP